MTMLKQSTSEDDASLDKYGDKKDAVKAGYLNNIKMIFGGPKKIFFMGYSTREVVCL